MPDFVMPLQTSDAPPELVSDLPAVFYFGRMDYLKDVSESFLTAKRLKKYYAQDIRFRACGAKQ